MTEISVIIPAFKRVAQTLKTIDLIFSSIGFKKSFDMEIIIVDGSPDNVLRDKLKSKFGSKVIYARSQREGISSSKNTGARIATHPLLIFCDSDIEVEEDTILSTINFLKEHKTVAALGGQVFWRGGKRDGALDRPRPEDRRKKINETIYVEAIYSRYIATYKKVFWNVGGYDETVFNMRGEGSDLSIRYWRAGYPLAFTDSIKVHHVHDAPDSAALRISHPEWGIAKDLVLLAYKYDMLDKYYENFSKTLEVNFEQFGKDGYFRIVQGIGVFLGFITKVKPKIDGEKKTMKKMYDFKFLEVFSEEKLFRKCLDNADALLSQIRHANF